MNLPVFEADRLYVDIVLFPILITSLYYDLKSNIIPNFLTYGAMLFGTLMLFLMDDSRAIQSHGLGLVLGFGLFFVFFVFGWVGGGDVKLMGAIGLLKGIDFLIRVIVYTSIFGAVIALCFLVYALFHKVEKKAARMPYGTAICLGSFMVLAMDYGIVSRW
jgi:prepilin peptidase CpaA